MKRLPAHTAAMLAKNFRRCLLAGSAIVGLYAATPAALLHSTVKPADSAVSASQMEIQMWQLINNDRTSPLVADETRGRAKPLQWDDRLAAVARAHSEELARSGNFTHQGADGSLPNVRISRAGIAWRTVGENIAEAYDIAQAEKLFMNEPRFQQNHRANILKPDYTHVGVGIAYAPDGMIYITQDFAQVPQ